MTRIAAQGNGEVNLTALECAFKEIRIQPIVRKDMKIEWPFIETRTHWISVGLHEDLNVAIFNAARGSARDALPHLEANLGKAHALAIEARRRAG